jgi:hypothetical protein
MNATGGEKIRKCWRYLEEAKLAFERIERPKEPPDLPAFTRTSTYVRIWARHMNERICHFVLTDLSLLHFRYGEGDSWAGLMFMQCPYVVPLYDPNAPELRGERLAKDVFLEAAETYPLRPEPQYLRFDLDEANYNPLAHPLAHLHVGLNTSIRIACQRLWSPASFVSFVMRQVYPEQWSRFVESRPNHAIFRQIRDGLSRVPPDFSKGHTRECVLS